MKNHNTQVSQQNTHHYSPAPHPRTDSTFSAPGAFSLSGDTAFQQAKAAASTSAILAQYRREHAIEDNKYRLKKLFYSGPAMVPQASVAESADEEPTYMGYPVSEFEDEPPYACNEQYGGDL
jgi:hypothetical protein